MYLTPVLQRELDVHPNRGWRWFLHDFWDPKRYSLHYGVYIPAKSLQKYFTRLGYDFQTEYIIGLTSP